MRNIFILFAALLISCKSPQTVIVPEIHTDTVRIVQQQRDSIHVHDSIYVTQMQKGDTVYLTTDRWHTQWRDRVKVDTMLHIQRDSIPYPVEVVKEVPAELTWWQKLRMNTGTMTICTLLAMGAFWLLRRKS